MSKLPISDCVITNPTLQELMQTPVGEWQRIFNTDAVAAYLHIRGKHCMIALEPRPDYCDRGSWLAKLVILDPNALCIDYHDGWYPGRYYFDKERAILECEAWLRARKQVDDWTLPEKLEKLNITAPSDWNEYDAYLLNGGNLEYEEWRQQRESDRHD